MTIAEMYERRDRLAAELATLDQMIKAKVLRAGKGKQKHTPSVKLTFGKNVITWDGGAVTLEGVEYKIVATLYAANKMRLKEATLGKRAWGDEPTHRAFRERVRSVTEKLEKAKFPYRLLPVMSKPRMVLTGEKFPNGKPKQKCLRPVIIGFKFNDTSPRANVAVDFYPVPKGDKPTLIRLSMATGCTFVSVRRCIASKASANDVLNSRTVSSVALHLWFLE